MLDETVFSPVRYNHLCNGLRIMEIIASLNFLQSQGTYKLIFFMPAVNISNFRVKRKKKGRRQIIVGMSPTDLLVQTHSSGISYSPDIHS